MSYLVLARKYRPQTFQDVVAQEHVTRTLRHAVQNDRVASGYLFCGPRGTGKTTVARILAKAINCANGPAETPCGECPACREITSGSSLDVLEIDAASNTGVDDIRTLRENVRYMPTSGKKRIYIIDEVHRLSGSAFDALLKTLEEPPPHVMFVFATTEPLKVPETILSRTQRFDFRRVSADELTKHLRNIAAKEKLDADDTALKLMARKADGSVRDALSLLDQIAAFAGEKITETDVVDALGLVDRRFLFEFVDAIAGADRGKALLLIKRLFESGTDASDFVAELLEHLHILLVLRTDEKSGELLNLPEAELRQYREQAQHFSVGDILRLLKIIVDLNTDLKTNLDERLLLEITSVKMADMESTVRFEEVLARMAARHETDGEPVTPNTNSTPDFFKPPTQQTSTAASGKASDGGMPGGEAASSAALHTRPLNLPQIQAGWKAFLTLLQSSSRMLASQLSMAEIRSVKDNQIMLVFAASAEPSMQLVTKPDSLNLIRKALREHYKANLSVEFTVDPAKKTPEDEQRENKFDKSDARDIVEGSPRLKKIVELVDGEVIGARRIK